MTIINFLSWEREEKPEKKLVLRVLEHKVCIIIKSKLYTLEIIVLFSPFILDSCITTVQISVGSSHEQGPISPDPTSPKPSMFILCLQFHVSEFSSCVDSLHIKCVISQLLKMFCSIYSLAKIETRSKAFQHRAP